MEILNEATLYEGIADFDMEGILKEYIGQREFINSEILKEYLKNAKLRNKIL